MKINKLMLAMAVAATTIAACNKQETTPQVDVIKSLKSVTLNLSNATFTKSGTSDALMDNKVVTLNNMQVFFSDGTNLYQAYDATGNTPATTYFTAVPTGEAAQFHFLPNEVVEVIVIANHGEKALGTANAVTKIFPTTKAQLLDGIKNLSVDADQTQDAKNLPLYGIDSDLTYNGESHAEDHGHDNPVYLAADVKLVPAVARFEVVGFQYAQDGENPRKYEQVEVEQLVFRNYNTTATVNSFAGNVTAAGADENALATLPLGDGNIFTWFADMLTKGWYADEPKVVLADDVEYTWGMVPAVANVAPASEYSYHVFPGTMIPEFDLKIKGNGFTEGEGDAAVTYPTVPLYLKTETLHVATAEGAALASIEAGYIYRMAMVFDDTDFENPEKCIDLTVTVAPWAVQIIVPEF